MAIPFLTSINLRGNETQNQVLHLTSQDPTSFISSDGGNIYYNTNSDVVKYYDGSTSGWQTVASQAWTTSNFLSSSADSITIGDSTIALGGTDTTLTGLTDIDLTAGNKTIFDGVGNATLFIGAQSTNVFINGNFEVNGNTEMQGLTLGDELNMQGSKIISVGDPTSTQDAANKYYVDTRSITIGDSTITIGGTDTTLTGLTDIDLTSGDKTIFDGVGANNLTIGAGTTTVVIPGDLQVTGTTTTNNVETVSTSNGVVFEGNVADANELTLLAGTLTADRTVTLPDATGTVALTTDPIGVNGISGLTESSTVADGPENGYFAFWDDDAGSNKQITLENLAKEIITSRTALIDVSLMGSNTTATITHNLSSNFLIVQMYDTTTGEVVFADIDHTSSSATNIIFSSTPTNDIRVVIIDTGIAKMQPQAITPTYS